MAATAPTTTEKHKNSASTDPLSSYAFRLVYFLTYFKQHHDKLLINEYFRFSLSLCISFGLPFAFRSLACTRSVWLFYLAIIVAGTHIHATHINFLLCSRKNGICISQFGKCLNPSPKMETWYSIEFTTLIRKWISDTASYNIDVKRLFYPNALHYNSVLIK